MFRISAVNLAKYIIWRADEENIRITMLKVQKILYFLQRNNIEKYGEPLFDERIEKWQYGPVVRRVYFEFCNHGAMPMHSEDKEKDAHICDDLYVDIRKTLDAKLDELLNISARDLTRMAINDGPVRNVEYIQKDNAFIGIRQEITVKSIKSFLDEGRRPT